MQTTRLGSVCARVWFVAAMMFVSLLVFACDCGSGSGKAVPPCERDDAPASCGAACTNDADCAGPTYCGPDDSCTADCGPPGTSCEAENLVCTSKGTCQVAPDSGLPDSGLPDSSFPDGCVDVDLMPQRVVPNVVLLIDQSGSMNVDDVSMSGGATLRRWNAVRELLIGRCNAPGRDPSGGICTGLTAGNVGVVGRTHEFINYSLALYTSDGGGSYPTQCPVLTTTPIAADNYTAIRDLFMAEKWEGDTPTGDSIKRVMETIFDPSDPNPTIIVLATDGEPDSCACPNFGSCGNCCPNSQASVVQQQVLDEAAAAFAQGVRTFVLAISGAVAGNAHFQQLANVGSGLPATGGGTAPLYEASSGAAIEAAFDEIITGALSCDIDLRATVQPQDLCKGTVVLEGVTLECNGANGYSRVDDQHIRLEGTACETWLENADASLQATWPCGTIIIIPG